MWTTWTMWTMWPVNVVCKRLAPHSAKHCERCCGLAFGTCAKFFRYQDERLFVVLSGCEKVDSAEALRFDVTRLEDAFTELGV